MSGLVRVGEGRWSDAMWEAERSCMANGLFLAQRFFASDSAGHRRMVCLRKAQLGRWLEGFQHRAPGESASLSSGAFPIEEPMAAKRRRKTVNRWNTQGQIYIHVE